MLSWHLVWQIWVVISLLLSLLYYWRNWAGSVELVQSYRQQYSEGRKSWAVLGLAMFFLPAYAAPVYWLIYVFLGLYLVFAWIRFRRRD